MQVMHHGYSMDRRFHRITQNAEFHARCRFTLNHAISDSRRIQKLEEWLGSQLFYREERPVTLTPAGEEFLDRAPRLREDIFDARRAVLSASSHFKKTLRIYTTNTLASMFLSNWIIKNKLENYSLIVASIAGCIEAVKRNNADMALIPHFEHESTLQGVEVEKVSDDRLVLLTSQSQKRLVALNKTKLCGPMMVYTPGTTYSIQIGAMLNKHHIQIQDQPVCESASAEALLSHVKAGLGAAWIPEILSHESKVTRCSVPSYFDIPYKILRISPLKKNP